MTDYELSEIVSALRPGAEFVIRDNDISQIEWHSEGVAEVTQAEIDAEVMRLAKASADRKAAALAKLDALGLTTDDLAALGLGS